MTTAAGKLTLDQGVKGYRFSQDSFLLADFFRLNRPVGTKSAQTSLVDLCAGSGVVSMLIKTSHPDIRVTAVEISPSLAKTALSNARASGADNYNVVCGDIMDCPTLFRGGCFDAVVCNPPYRKAGTGRINPCPEKAVARHEIKMTLGGMVSVSAHLLKHGGSLSLVMLHERRGEYTRILKENGFMETRTCNLLKSPNGAPWLFISEAILSYNPAPVEQEPDMTMTMDGSARSDRVERILSGYANA